QHLLILLIFSFSILLSPVRRGLGAAEGRCLNLSGVCRRDVCKVVEDQIGACRRRMKCCRAWRILMPIPAPLIMSDYQEPLKPKLK
ncbi:beta-defensin 109-like, partial [Trachypithecus francoisi]|uniref:beta-defensin 109-like n=1 Tax=Trachypithecus francoisi TaxID=54180 RepID=UPI00141B347F